MTKKRTGDRPNTFAREAWLLMLTEGGHWSSKELCERLKVGGVVSVHSHFFRMASCGYVVQLGEGKGKVRYGVTTACKVPTGVTLGEINKATALTA